MRSGHTHKKEKWYGFIDIKEHPMFGNSIPSHEIGIEHQILTKFQFYGVESVLSILIPKFGIQLPNIAK